MNGTGLNCLADGVQDELHTLFAVELVNWGVLQFFFQFTFEGVEQEDAGLLAGHIVNDLQHPHLNALFPLPEGSQVALVIVPDWCSWCGTTSELDSRLGSSKTVP
jgi:hypothetical protein